MEELIKIAGFDSIETEYISNLYRRLECCDKQLLQSLGTDFMSGKGAGICADIKQQLEPLADRYNSHIYSIHLLFMASCLERLRTNYINKGIDESLYYDISKDLKYKLDECKKVYGVIGIFTFDWYYKIFNMETFALGRFQYHADVFFADKYTYGDITVSEGEPVYRFHIPSSGPMTKEERIASYKKAFEFFGKKKGEYLILTCSSWLLDTVNKNIYPVGSNLLDFMSDFDIIETHTAQQASPFANAWRVFGMYYTGDTSILPSKTTLQKNYIKWLESGNSVGSGNGVIIFDGEKIINTKDYA